MVSGMTCFVKWKSCFFTNQTILPIYVSTVPISLVTLVYPHMVDVERVTQACFKCLHESIESKQKMRAWLCADIRGSADNLALVQVYAVTQLHCCAIYCCCCEEIMRNRSETCMTWTWHIFRSACASLSVRRVTGNRVSPSIKRFEDHGEATSKSTGDKMEHKMEESFRHSSGGTQRRTLWVETSHLHFLSGRD